MITMVTLLNQELIALPRRNTRRIVMRITLMIYLNIQRERERERERERAISYGRVY